MKILVEGTKEEIEGAKNALEQMCLFDNKFCNLNMKCKECEQKQNLVIKYVIK